MLIRPASSEIAILCRGIIALMLVVLLGVSLAENQLNTLTQRQECVQFINIHRDKTGIYSFYLFGMEYSVRGVYNIARVTNNDRKIKIEANGYKLDLPTYLNINYSQIQSVLNMWHRQFVEEAIKFKHSLQDYVKEIKHSFQDYAKEFKYRANYYIDQYR